MDADERTSLRAARDFGPSLLAMGGGSSFSRFEVLMNEESRSPGLAGATRPASWTAMRSLSGGIMFERYTEKARRVIFFARYEASQFGSPYIETEHLLLGLLREDKALTNRFLRSHASVESIRKQIEGHTTLREKVSTSRRSAALERVQACAGLCRGRSRAALAQTHWHGTSAARPAARRQMLCRGNSPRARPALASHPRRAGAHHAGKSPPQQQRSRESSLLAEFSRDLTQAATDNQLDPLVGRDSEVERVIQILCRRTKNNPVLIGEPGVGKTAIVEGLAQRIADGEVPSFLAEKRVLALDLSLIVAGTKYRGQFEERLKTIMKELMENQNSIIFIDELHTLVGAGSAEGSLDAANILKPALSRGEIQCIGATTPAEYRKSIEKDRSLERRFQAVKVPPPNEEDAIKIIMGIKERYEKFHAVSYTDDAINFAVSHSNRYIPDRFLPDKAIDLIDEAGARVKLRQTSLPEEFTEVQKRIKFIVHRMENAIANHEFEKARFYSDEERKERDNLRALRDKYHLDDSSAGIVGREDIEDVVSRWTGVPITSIKEEETQKLLRVEEELHKRVISQDKAISALAARDSPLARRPEIAAPSHRHRSSSSAPPASAKPKWRAPSRSSSSAARNRSSASICRSSWRSTPSPSSSARLRATSATRKAASSPSASSVRPTPSCCSTKSRRRIRTSSTSCCRCLKTASSPTASATRSTSRTPSSS